MSNIIETQHVDFYYGNFKALRNINIDIPEKAVTAFIGPSGCGKSTLLRLYNRMNDLVDGAKLEGKILIDGEDIYDKKIIVEELRKKVGMVFQKPNPFPKSIFENVAYGLKVQGMKNKTELENRVEDALKKAALWEEVQAVLDKSALQLSGGQQQRLCIARCLAINPEIILMDEPASALDPISTAKIEELILQLKDRYTIVIVTHNMQQAVRVSSKTAFFYLGELVEFNDTNIIFENPERIETRNYVTGKFG
ncbi:MAG: phosphate ABC transporter ATP-binding protein [Bacteroidetes bacterium]|nr:phosphate ABC transporter ATP-binding protein [Bacteroidota bacterium]